MAGAAVSAEQAPAPAPKLELLQPGRYRLRVDTLKAKPLGNGRPRHLLCLVTEVEVLEVLEAQGEAATPAGARAYLFDTDLLQHAPWWGCRAAPGDEILAEVWDRPLVGRARARASVRMARFGSTPLELAQARIDLPPIENEENERRALMLRSLPEGAEVQLDRRCAALAALCPVLPTAGELQIVKEETRRFVERLAGPGLDAAKTGLDAVLRAYWGERGL
jgi:hypothetical protein